MLFVRSPKAVLLWETLSSGVRLMCPRGSTEESGPENQGEEEGVLSAAASASFFPRRYLCGCPQEPLPAWLYWQGEELLFCLSGAKAV